MFKLNKKAYEGNATTELVANVVKELGKMFDVLSKVILQNKKDIRDLQSRVKDLENKWANLNTAKVRCVILIELKTG